jgi:hypothetical protein
MQCLHENRNVKSSFSSGQFSLAFDPKEVDQRSLTFSLKTLFSLGQNRLNLLMNQSVTQKLSNTKGRRVPWGDANLLVNAINKTIKLPIVFLRAIRGESCCSHKKVLIVYDI